MSLCVKDNQLSLAEALPASFAAADAQGNTRSKLGIANKRLKAGWNVSYLSQLLGLCNQGASCACPKHSPRFGSCAMP